MSEHNPDLDPRYEAPEMDSMLQVKFIGNTARIADINFRNIDPFQLYALAEYFKRYADRTLTLSEREEAMKEQAENDEELTKPKGYDGKPKIITPGDLRG